MDIEPQLWLPNIVEVPEALRVGVGGGPYWKECFSRAWVYFLGHTIGKPTASMCLVHGIWRGNWKHAWVEIEEHIVFDGVMQQFYERESYYVENWAWPIVEFDTERPFGNGVYAANRRSMSRMLAR